MAVPNLCYRVVLLTEREAHTIRRNQAGVGPPLHHSICSRKPRQYFVMGQRCLRSVHMHAMGDRLLLGPARLVEQTTMGTLRALWRGSRTRAPSARTLTNAGARHVLVRASFIDLGPATVVKLAERNSLRMSRRGE
jgi:hypothetical protein